MTVLELMATLGLDTTDFDTKLTGAVEDVQELSDKTEQLTSPQLGGKTQTALQPMIDDAESVDAKLLDLQTKTTETSSLMTGLLNATSEIVEKLIEGIIEFGAQSIEAAASTGSALALSFNNAKDEFDLSVESLKLALGEDLLPIAELAYEIGDAIIGRTTTDKLNTLAQQLQSLSQVKLTETTAQVEKFLDVWDSIATPKAGDLFSNQEYANHLEEQAVYWETYTNALESLKEKGVDPAFLAELADGTSESANMLITMDQATTEELGVMVANYERLKAAEAAAAESMSTVALAIDENATAISDAMAILLTGNVTEYHKDENQVAMIMQNYIDDLTEKYPIVESLVNQVNAKLAELGYAGDNPLGLDNSVTGEPGGRIYAGEVGEGENKSAYIARIDVELAEGSEEGLQGEVDSMSLGGEVLVIADPTSGSKIQTYLNGLNLTATVKLNVDDSSLAGYGEGRAVGLDYVPYDNYAARLHEGEAVLTKAEAERWRRGEFRSEGSGDGIVVNQYITVAKNQDFGTEVREALEMMRWTS